MTCKKIEKLTGEIVGDKVGLSVGSRIVGLRVGFVKEWIQDYKLATQTRDKKTRREVNVVLTLSVG